MKRIFLVENHAFFRLTVQNFIEKNNYILIDSKNEKNSLRSNTDIRRIKEMDVDILIIDLELYKKDIIDVIRFIKSVDDNTSIIVMVSEKDVFLEKALHEEGILGVLMKPFSEIQLINMIDSI